MTAAPTEAEINAQIISEFSSDLYDGFLGDFEDTHEQVYEDDEVVIFVDEGGQEYNELADNLEYADVDRSAISEWHHEQARERTDYDWSAADPVVLRK